MHILKNILIVVAILLAHWSVGEVLFQTVLRKFPWSNKLNREMRFLHAMVMGSLVFFILSVIQLILPQKIVMLLLVCALLFSLLWVSRTFLKHRPAFHRPPLLEIIFYSLLALITLGAVFVISKSNVPGPFNFGYGDLAAFYRVAENIFSKERPLVDFTVLDYPNGFYLMPVYFPFHVLFQALSLHLLPQSIQTMAFHSIIFTVLSFILLKNIFQEHFPKLNLYWMLALLLIPWFINRNIIHLFFSYPNASSSFLFLFLFYLADHKKNYPGAIFWVLSTFLVFVLALARPENTLLLLVYFAAWILLNMCFNWKSRSGKVCLFVTLVASASVVIFLSQRPEIIDNIVLGNILWDPALQKFRFNDWGMFASNFRVTLTNLGLEDPFPLANKFGVAALEHPFALLSFFYSSAYLQLGLLNSIIIMAGFCLGLFVFRSLRDVKQLAVAATIFLFPGALFIANSAMTGRHFLPYFYLLMVFSILWASQLSTKHRWGGLIKIFLPVVIITVISGWSAFQFQVAYRIQERDTTNRFLLTQPFFNELTLQERSKKPVVASTYPQVTALLTDLPSVGGTFLRTNFSVFLEKFRPDILIMDNARPEPGAQLFKEYLENAETRELIQKMYVEVAGNSELEYKIFKKKMNAFL